MIPSAGGLLNQNLVIEEQPSKTYKMQIDTNVIHGYCDREQAMEQAIYKILNTERYQYIIYSWNYGVELLDLYGEPPEYVCPELERRITEALTQDNRITSVDTFEFDIDKNKIHVTFVVHTIFGDVESRKDVDIDV